MNTIESDTIKRILKERIDTGLKVANVMSDEERKKVLQTFDTVAQHYTFSQKKEQ